MFPTLEPAEVDRLRRFGDLRSYPSGEYLERTGEAGPGMIIILSGEVAITERDDRAPGSLSTPRSAGPPGRTRARLIDDSLAVKS